MVDDEILSPSVGTYRQLIVVPNGFVDTPIYACRRHTHRMKLPTGLQRQLQVLIRVLGHLSWINVDETDITLTTRN